MDEVPGNQSIISNVTLSLTHTHIYTYTLMTSVYMYVFINCTIDRKMIWI